MPLSDEPPDYLRRLPRGWYTGHSWVHWTMTIEGRKKGWLDERMHASIREFLIHTLARNQLVCPAYCLMPDHGHFLWLGTAAMSDQQAATRFFRRSWNMVLKSRGFELQKQPHDHVLNTVHYILKDPERAGWVSDWREWRYLGAAAAGYPDTDPRDPDWLPRFWKLHGAEMRKHAGG